MFGGRHSNSNSSTNSSSSSTTNNTTWNAGAIESFLMNEYNPDIYYENQNATEMSDSMKRVLGFGDSGQGIKTGRNIIAKGLGVGGNAVEDFRAMKAVTGQDVYNNWKLATTAIYGDLGGFMENQNQAIEDKIMVDYGGDAANFNTQQMNSNNGTYTSAQAYGNTALSVGAANSMASQESELAKQVLATSGAIAGSGMRSMSNKNKQALALEAAASTGLVKSGAGLVNKGIHNMWQSGVVETGYQNYVNKLNRRNDMINGNLPLVEQMMWLNTMLSAAGIDTTSHTDSEASASSSRSSTSGGGRVF